MPLSPRCETHLLMLCARCPATNAYLFLTPRAHLPCSVIYVHMTMQEASASNETLVGLAGAESVEGAAAPQQLTQQAAALKGDPAPKTPLDKVLSTYFSNEELVSVSAVTSTACWRHECGALHDSGDQRAPSAGRRRRPLPPRPAASLQQHCCAPARRARGPSPCLPQLTRVRITVPAIAFRASRWISNLAGGTPAGLHAALRRHLACTQCGDVRRGAPPVGPGLGQGA